MTNKDAHRVSADTRLLRYNEFIRVQNRTTWSILESGHMVPVERMLSNKEQSLCDSDTIIGHSYQINQGYEVHMLF